MAKRPNPTEDSQLVDETGNLAWLQDAPLFIDRKAIDRLYEAIVRPANTEVGRKVTIERGLEGSATGGLEGRVKLGFGSLLKLLRIGEGEGEVKAHADATAKVTRAKAQTIELQPISTPERKLAQIALVYFAEHNHRLLAPQSPHSIATHESELLAASPKQLVFLDFGGLLTNSFPLMLIPTAAEFADGSMQLLYLDLLKRLGKLTPPKYPEREQDVKKRRGLEKEYWAFYAEHFSEIDAIEVVESASTKLGRIQWIDYRLPLDADGNTLHIHVVPDGSYDTGTFAYQFIRRGYKHGIRLVGTLKSGPAMDVLAIFEK
ncbi:MAG: hypothetical protein NCW75_04185 [Phycisphaera sp.]|nr:MAG: hypothetical protein NCW75_04185 [Phycisphaera sp.]